MATTYRVVWQCAGGEHLRVEVDDGSGKVYEVPMTRTELTELQPPEAPVAIIRKIMTATGKTVDGIIEDMKLDPIADDVVLTKPK